MHQRRCRLGEDRHAQIPANVMPVQGLMKFGASRNQVAQSDRRISSLETTAPGCSRVAAR